MSHELGIRSPSATGLSLLYFTPFQTLTYTDGGRFSFERRMIGRFMVWVRAGLIKTNQDRGGFNCRGRLLNVGEPFILFHLLKISFIFSLLSTIYSRCMTSMYSHGFFFILCNLSLAFFLSSIRLHVLLNTSCRLFPLRRTTFVQMIDCIQHYFCWLFSANSIELKEKSPDDRLPYFHMDALWISSLYYAVVSFAHPPTSRCTALILSRSYLIVILMKTHSLLYKYTMTNPLIPGSSKNNYKQRNFVISKLPLPAIRISSLISYILISSSSRYAT